MRRRDIILYWLLIGVPAVLLGIAAVRQLRGEGERLRDMVRRGDRERAERLADALRGMVAATQGDLMEQLRAMPAESLDDSLRSWERDHPLVRNVFVWEPRVGARLPAARGATEEERRFLQRYAPLLRGEIPWHQPLDPVVAAAPSPADSPRQRAKIEIESLGLYGRRAVARQAAAPAAAAAPGAPASGWRCWFEGNQLHLLGWSMDADGTVRGVEMETAALLSRLLPLCDGAREEGLVHVLRDGEGRSLHQVGSREITAMGTPAAVAALAPELPHWEVTSYRVAGAGAGTGRGMMAFAWLLLALLLAALVGGGALLIRDAARQRRDAMQKTNFVSSVSHELKTPLTSIRMYAELLRDGRVRDASRGRKYLDVIVAESHRLTRLVNNVLDFSRLEQGRRRFARETLDAKALVSEVAEAQRGRLEAEGLRLLLSLPDAPATVVAERDAVEQVLVNLLDNAAKYAAGGGEVTLEVTAAEGGVRIGVLDRGAGIAPTHRRRLFERFYRVDGALTASHTGCGLGLSIARRLLRGMGGDLIFEPRAGGGSAFVLIFGERP